MRHLATALFACTVLHAPAAEVGWLPRWKTNDTASYEVERCRKSNAPGKPVNACLKGQLEIEVLRADSKGSLQRWRSNAIVDELTGSGLPAEAAAALGEASSLALDIEFDDVAQPIRLVNATEVRVLLDKTTDALTAATADDKALDPKLVAGVKALMSHLTSTDERLLAMVSRDVGILYSPLGGSFTVGETVSIPSSIPSPFGTAPLRSTIAVTTSLAKPDGAELELQLAEDIDRAGLLEVMDEMLKPLIQATDKPEAAAEMKRAMSSVIIQRFTTYKVVPDDAWASHVYWRETIEVGSRQRVTTLTFKRTR